MFSRIESVEYSAQTELAAGNWPEVILVVKEIQRRHLTHKHTESHIHADFAVERVLRQVFVAVCAWAWLVILNVCVCMSVVVFRLRLSGFPGSPKIILRSRLYGNFSL